MRIMFLIAYPLGMALGQAMFKLAAAGGASPGWRLCA